MMQVVENRAERLVLKGTPGSVRWMLFATCLGAAFMAVTAWFASVSVRAIGSYLQLLPLGVGFLMGLAFFLMGLVTLVVGRMQLVLDRIAGIGTYDVYSPIIEVGKPCTFQIDEIDSVAIERQQEARPSGDEHGNFPAKICRARLRLRKPRRAIVLDETENGQESRVQGVAEEVAKWLNLEVVERG